MDLSASLNASDGYRQLVQQISDTYTQGRVKAVQAVNAQLVQTYWHVGRHIVEFEQAGQVRAEYGKALIDTLAADLGLRHGKGFSRSNLIRFRQFYLAYPGLAEKSATLSHQFRLARPPEEAEPPLCGEARSGWGAQLTWSHIVELLKIDDLLERGFYEQQALRERWSVRELVRQKESSLFLRLAASQDKAGILQLAAQGQVVEQPADLLREPYVFEFLKIPEPYQVSETQLETLLCDHLQPFLLELGKGFTFVGRQYRVTINGTHHRVDLVFYHRILRCFVLIDLKLGEVQHNDIGQMNLYLGYFANEENAEGDNPPVGIILSRQKDELLVEYATYGMSSQLFVQKYQLYLPDREALRRELEETLREAGQ